jgi:hypothetical protein
MPPEANQQTDPNTNQNQQDPQPGGETPPDTATSQSSLVYDSWIDQQDPQVVTMIDDHYSGLTKALGAERADRKALKKELDTLADKLEGDHQQTIRTMSDNLASAELKAAFFEDAIKSGVKNVPMAYAVAVQFDLFDRRGVVDFDEMRKNYPELFAVTGNISMGAGAGLNSPAPKGSDMNQMIRKAAGRP